MKKDKAEFMCNKLSPMVEGLSDDELFTLAGYCILELVIQNIGYNNFNIEHEEEIYKELELACTSLNKQIKKAFKLLYKGK